MSKIGRNDSCPCGSGRKYKHCCGSLINSQLTAIQEAKHGALQNLLDAAFEHLQSNRLEEALQACVQVLSVDAKNPQALHWVGLIAYRRGQHGSAVEFLQQAMQLEPGAAVCSNLGLALHANGDLHKAIDLHQAALRHQPAHAASHNNLANSLKEIGNIDAAVTHYRKAIEYAPDLVPAIQNLKSVFDQIRFVNAQLQAFAITVDFECNLFAVDGIQVKGALPNSPHFFSVLAATMVERAVHYIKLEDLPKAEEICQTLRRVIPNHADALYLLGAMAKCRGRNALGEELLQKASGFDSKLADKYDWLNLHSARAASSATEGAFRPSKPSDAWRDGANNAAPGDTIQIVSATRMSEDEFWANSALGQSLRSIGGDRSIVASVAFNNQRGLPDIYNAKIAEEGEDRILVFIHDDVWIDDLFFADRLIHALKHFDVIGVAGNSIRLPRQAGWGFLDANLTPSDLCDLRGSISHGPHAFGKYDSFGESPAPCELLDGVILVARRSRLQIMNVRFDPLFKFHFYDIDFCRAARQAGLRLGTWPLHLTHQSKGAFKSESWMETYPVYLNKWGS